MQDLKKKPKYLVTFTVGLDQMHNINAAVKKVLKHVHNLFYLGLLILILIFKDTEVHYSIL